MQGRMQNLENNYPNNNFPMPQHDLSQNIRQNQSKTATKRNKAPSRNRNEWNKDAQQPENLPQK